MRLASSILRVALLLVLSVGTPAWAEVAGQVTYQSGTLSARNAAGVTRLLAAQSPFHDGEVLTTAQGSFARLRFVDGTEVALRPETSLDVREVRFREEQPAGDSFAVGLVKGGLRAVTGAIGKRNGDRVRYDTPVATIGVRGTHFGLLFCRGDCAGLESLRGRPLRDGLHADVAQGRIQVGNRAGALLVDEGRFAYVANADTPPVLVEEDDAFRLSLPASVLFDTETQVWSDDVICDNCATR